MGADASIYSMTRPMQSPDPIEQYGKMVSIKSLLGQQDLQQLQTEAARRGLEQDVALQDLYAGATPEQISAPDFYRKLIATGGAKGASLAKTLVEGETAKANLDKTKIETMAAKAKQARDALAGVSDQGSYQGFLDLAKQQGWQIANGAPAQYDQGWVRQHLMTADKFIEQTTPKYEKNGDRWIDVNPNTNPNIRLAKVGVSPDAALSAKIKASESDPFGMLGIKDLVDRSLGGQNASSQSPGASSAPTSPAAAAASAGAVPNGEDFLKTIPKPVADQVKALAEGRMAFPAGFALKSPYWQNMISMVSQYDPNFDAVNYNARANTRKDFTSGQSSRSLNALNTVMGHLDELDKAASGLNNTGFTYWNQAVNAVKGSVDPDLKARLNKFNLTKQAVVDEMERAYRGAGGSQAGIDAWKKTLSDADSYTALRASIQQGVKLLESKIQALGDTYSKGMGTTAEGIELLAPHARDTFNRLIRDANEPRQSVSGEIGKGKGTIKFLGFE